MQNQTRLLQKGAVWSGSTLSALLDALLHCTIKLFFSRQFGNYFSPNCFKNYMVDKEQSDHDLGCFPFCQHSNTKTNLFEFSNALQ